MNASFPTGPRASFTVALHSYLEQTYRLDITDTTDLGGAYNLNTLVMSDKGRFVARVYRPWVTPLRLEALHRLKGKLKAQLPVVLPLPTADGHTVAPFDGRLLELEPFVPNSGAVESWGRYEEAFSLLGSLHGALAEFGPFAAALPAPKVENYGSPEARTRWRQRAGCSSTPTNLPTSSHRQTDTASASEKNRRPNRWVNIP